MIKSNKLLMVVTIFFILIMLFVSTKVYADSPITNPDYFDPSSSFNQQDADAVVKKVKPILNTISTVGVVVSVITLMVLGIKYMVGSVSEKAEYKKSMIPYIIGVILLFSVSAIVGLIANLTQGIFTIK